MNRLLSVALALAATASLAQSPYVFEGVSIVTDLQPAWSGPAERVGDRVRVASYNIENFSDGFGDGGERTPERVRSQSSLAASFIDEIDPHVIVLMEIENAKSLKILNDALKKPFPLAYVTKLGDGSDDEQKLNLAVLSRIPVEQVTETDFGPLRGPGRPTRGILRTVVALDPERRLAIYSLHLKSNFGNRQRNIAQRTYTTQKVRDDAEALRAAQPQYQWEMIVAGDMNIDPELPEFQGDTSLKPLAGWRDLWVGRPIHERTTVPTRFGDSNLEFPPAAFDRILTSADLGVAPWVAGEAQVLPKGVFSRDVNSLPGDNGHVSDHYPVWVDLTR